MSSLIKYVGVNDKKIDLFEGQYIVKNGISYNSYIILDDLITIMDTVDIHFCDAWISNIKEILKNKIPSFLVIHHMEPDHTGSVLKLLEVYPDITIIGNTKTFAFLKQFYPYYNFDKIKVITNNEYVVIGKNSLKFIFAPMIHWPEVMFTYVCEMGALFSADAFGKFGSLDIKDEWENEARRYYIGIVGKYGIQVQNTLKNVSSLNIKAIYPLHGPVIDKNITKALELYNKWSKYEYEDNGVLIVYSSIYGHTKEAALYLENELKNKINCQIFDIARCDIHCAVSDAFKYKTLVLATTTYNSKIFPIMHHFIDLLVERNYKNRTIGIIENGTWNPQASKVIKELLLPLQDIKYLTHNVTILSSMNDKNKEDISLLATEIIDNK
ncbi:MAG: hypothetical protein LBV51_02705 [Acholeplasmatales bacterium]|jgi:flavorubredoxin|nr:hypothetical protein [Acholeplasmatales bacterium]